MLGLASPDPKEPVNIFISYSHDDEKLCDELVTHLAGLRRQGKISEWYDRRIDAGVEWNKQIKHKLESANIILLLISASFINSDYCYKTEMTRAIELHKRGAARVIPIILRPCDWKNSPFSKLKVLPKDGKPVTQWPDRDAAFVNVTKGIRGVVDTLSDQVNLTTFKFEVLKVNYKGEEDSRSLRSGQYFEEVLEKDIKLRMVAISGGKYQMGSPEKEAKRLEEEGPLHSVNISPFFMGQYPITQAQWQIVASFPKVNYDLVPLPSSLEYGDLPISHVSWYDASEFCSRLTKRFRHTFRLPTEAEWEYACRAGTTSPFYFGATITPLLANYRGKDWQDRGIVHKGAYEDGPLGVYREGWTQVGSFPPNPFGLYDMHGNVWEWCLDFMHNSYNDAPTDGSAWMDGGDDTFRALRGGSWVDVPEYCRSAYRFWLEPNSQRLNIGFRVVCEAVNPI